VIVGVAFGVILYFSLLYNWQTPIFSMNATALVAAITTGTSTILAMAALAQISEMKKARLAERPQLRIFLNMAHVTVTTLRILNIGKLAAVDISLKIDFEKGDKVIEAREFNEAAMLPLGDKDLILPDSNFNNLLNALDRITVAGSYQDGFGKTFSVNESIDTKEFVDSVKSARMLMREKDKTLKEL
jgi:hypothetical protein